jgi:hypothetical protein
MCVAHNPYSKSAYTIKLKARYQHPYGENAYTVKLNVRCSHPVGITNHNKPLLLGIFSWELIVRYNKILHISEYRR